MNKTDDIMSQQRQEMVAKQIRGRGVRNRPVLSAMSRVPRELFVAPEFRHHAYEDTPLPIPAGQTISQPYVVALMIVALKLQPENKVLEIGTGSGYAAALLSQIVHQVYTIERHEELVQYAQTRFQELGYDNIQVRHGDGTMGWPEFAPFDGIVVAAGGPEVPDSLRQQLAIGGRLVIPISQQRQQQQLLRVTRQSEAKFKEEKLGHVRFVPLIGQEGWRKRE